LTRFDAECEEFRRSSAVCTAEMSASASRSSSSKSSAGPFVGGIVGPWVRPSISGEGASFLFDVFRNSQQSLHGWMDGWMNESYTDADVATDVYY